MPDYKDVQSKSLAPVCGRRLVVLASSVQLVFVLVFCFSLSRMAVAMQMRPSGVAALGSKLCEQMRNPARVVCEAFFAAAVES